MIPKNIDIEISCEKFSFDGEKLTINNLDLKELFGLVTQTMLWKIKKTNYLLVATIIAVFIIFP